MADKSLVIVESPAKAKTISKYLGKEYIVKSSVGHVRKLPKGEKAIDRKDWSISYEIDPKKTKVVKELKSAAKGVEDIFLATDLDREGESIKDYVFRGAFPVDLSPIDLAFSSTDEIERFTVTFAYQYFETDTTT